MSYQYKTIFWSIDKDPEIQELHDSCKRGEFNEWVVATLRKELHSTHQNARRSLEDIYQEIQQLKSELNSVRLTGGIILDKSELSESISERDSELLDNILELGE